MVKFSRMRVLIKHTVNLQWRKEREMARATKSTATITGMPRATDNHSKTEDGAIRISEVQDAYREVISELEAMRSELNPLLNSLDNPDHLAAMRLRYIKGYSPEDIAEANSKTPRSIYYYLSQAENKLARMYPEKVSK